MRLLLLALFTLCGLQTAAAQDFSREPCWFAQPRDREVTCGWLTVPENRADPANKHQVRLPVVVIEPERERHPPLVFLTGGPGQPVYIRSDEDIDYWFDYYDHTSYLRGRRLVLMDQRGAGMAEPLLDCPEMKDPYGWGGVTALPGYQEEPEGQLDPLTICANFFRDQAYDLAGFSTRESAADVEALRHALEIDKWVVFGVSYGTKLALAVLRDFGLGVEAVVLDSTLPPEADFIGDGGRAFDDALRQLNSDCLADSACHDHFGDLQAQVKETVTRLDASPLPLRLSDPEETPAFIMLDGSGYLHILFSSFYNWDDIERLPFLISRTAEQDYRFLAELAKDSYLSEDDLAYGLFLTIGCREEAPFLPSDRLDKESQRLPYLANWLAGDYLVWNCPDWPVTAAPALENEAVVSDVPVLLLSGEYDPVTPSFWSTNTLKNLSHGQHLVFRSLGHDVVDSSECGETVVGDFLANPYQAPKPGCLADQSAPYFIYDERDW